MLFYAYERPIQQIIHATAPKGQHLHFLKGIYESHIGRIDLMDVFKPL